MIATLAVRTGIAPQHLMSEDTEMLRYILAVIQKADNERKR